MKTMQIQYSCHLREVNFFSKNQNHIHSVNYLHDGESTRVGPPKEPVY